jgi:hypothetical protein
MRVKLIKYYIFSMAVVRYLKPSTAFTYGHHQGVELIYSKDSPMLPHAQLNDPHLAIMIILEFVHDQMLTKDNFRPELESDSKSYGTIRCLTGRAGDLRR